MKTKRFFGCNTCSKVLYIVKILEYRALIALSIVMIDLINYKALCVCTCMSAIPIILFLITICHINVHIAIYSIIKFE